MTKGQRGLTLIEILVTVVILAVGLLGLAGLMLEGLRNNQSAYLRTQASILAYDMADRMRTNSGQAKAGAYDDFDTSTSTVTAPGCASTGCTPAQLVTLDKAQWTEQIEGADDIALLPEGIGTIARNGNIFTITIEWKETLWDESTEKEQVTTQEFELDFRL